ncbi:MAG: BolA family transcriptional regulator [Deltaproteobacteria bacterium]|nr:BolA family transcriptional regulator [Deltaproteobacteria bacterium]
MRTLEQVRGGLAQAFPGDRVELDSSDNRHFSLLVVSPQFEGKSRVERHQLVYRALGDALQGAVHAVSIQALTPGEQK